MTLPKGVYEQLITRGLADALKALQGTPTHIDREALDPADSTNCLRVTCTTF